MKTAERQDTLRYLRNPALPGVELLEATSSTGNWRMLHERYLFCGCTSVSTSWVYRRKERHIEDGATAFMEPGEIHSVVAKRKPSHFMALFVEPEDFLVFAEEEGIAGMPHFSITEVGSPTILGNLHALSECLKNGKNDLELQSQMAVLMHEALQYAEVRPSVTNPGGDGLTRALRTARELLHERYKENVSLQELAKATALSRFHLVRMFTACYGLSPHAYQVQLRVRHACRMLRAGMSCAETASAVGFADQSHMARHFRKVMGVTPRYYARMHQEPEV